MFALVPAAGSGSRMGESPPKQYLLLAGRPLLQHALGALLASPQIEKAFVVLADGDREWSRYDWSIYGSRVEPLRCGGATRAQSVRNGLAMAPGIGEQDWVLVHDAARPCLPAEALRRLIETLGNDPVGGLLALRVADTLKRGDAEDRVIETVPRAGIWQAQTPQMFRRGRLLQALQLAGAEVTDEAAAVEALGLKPRLVPGDPRNVKITFPEDLAVAEMILASMESTV